MTRISGAATQACVSSFSQISHTATASRRCGRIARNGNSNFEQVISSRYHHVAAAGHNSAAGCEP
jgi:hypothetical protein